MTTTRHRHRTLAIVVICAVEMLGVVRAGSDREQPVTIQHCHNAATSRVIVRGLDRSQLDRIAAMRLNRQQWQQILNVRVAAPGDAEPDGTEPDGNAPDDAVKTSLLGSWTVADNELIFAARFPFEPGIGYIATLDVAAFNNATRDNATRDNATRDNATLNNAALNDATPAIAVQAKAAASSTNSRLLRTFRFAVAATDDAKPARVVSVFPSSDRWPENLLRFYIHFSAPMSRGRSWHQIELRDQTGNRVDDPWLELPEELWDPQRQRFTVLIDPGRVKRGLKPREDVGAVFESGRSYTLIIRRNWRDGRGHPLSEDYVKQFIAGAPDLSQPDPSAWTIRCPSANTIESLIVEPGESLDHGLLLRLLAVEYQDGRPVYGQASILPDESFWLWTPDAAWEPGNYQLVIGTSLEDPAGNSIAQPFEVDPTRKPAEPTEREIVLRRPFTVTDRGSPVDPRGQQ